jgi:hypothetical protein
MRYRSVICSFLSAGLLHSSSQAQTGDWQAVKKILPGSRIFVKSYPQSARCEFENATETELFCERSNLRIDFHRQNIRQVRLEHPNRSAVLGAVIGTGIGAGVGVAATKDSKDAETRVYDPILLGIVMGVILSVIMSRVSPLHGKVVYQR